MATDVENPTPSSSRIWGGVIGRLHLELPFLLLIGFGSLIPVLMLLTIWIATPIRIPEHPKNSYEYIYLFKWHLTTAQAGFYASVTGAIFTGVGFLAAIVGMTTTIRDRRKERAHQITFEWNSTEITRDIRILRQRVFPILGKYANRPAVAFHLIQRDDDLYDAVRHILNTLEDWSIAIESNYVDRKIVEESMTNIFLYYSSNLKPFIDAARMANSDSKDYFLQLEIYVNHLKARRAAREKPPSRFPLARLFRKW